MFLTVAICTWNRARLLDLTLTRMQDLRIPDGVTWELLVVNNNCTDDTDSIIEKHRPYLPLVRLFEPKQGHSNARNCAVDHAQGKLLVWTDDDVLVDPNWLSQYFAVFLSHPDSGYYGGPVDPWFETSPPRWLTRHWSRIHYIYAIRQLPGGDREFASKEYPYGANLAFRTDLLKSYRFDPNLGRLGSELRGYDEIQVIEGLRQAGFRGRWVSGARVKHFIAANRMTLKYVWDWYRWDGRVDFQRQGGPAEDSKTVLGRPRWLIRKYIEARMKAAGGCLTRGETWRAAFVDAAKWKGVLDLYAGTDRGRDAAGRGKSEKPSSPHRSLT
jgi:glycosyltransferase involved in cell wall biosynthesis